MHDNYTLCVKQPRSNVCIRISENILLVYRNILIFSLSPHCTQKEGISVSLCETKTASDTPYILKTNPTNIILQQ